MKLVVAVIVLLAVGAIAQPPRPKPASTFTGMGEAERHEARETFIGEFKMAVDMGYKGAGAAMEILLFKDYNLTRVVRYDLKKAYVRRQEPGKECTVGNRNINGTIEDFWGWVGCSTTQYEGTVKIREQTYDIWADNVAGVRVELLVKDGAADTPVILNRETAGDRDGFIFKTFTAGTPPATDFDVPTC